MACERRADPPRSLRLRCRRVVAALCQPCAG